VTEIGQKEAAREQLAERQTGEDRLKTRNWIWIAPLVALLGAILCLLLVDIGGNLHWLSSVHERLLERGMLFMAALAYFAFFLIGFGTAIRRKLTGGKFWPSKAEVAEARAPRALPRSLRLRLLTASIYCLFAATSTGWAFTTPFHPTGVCACMPWFYRIACSGGLARFAALLLWLSALPTIWKVFRPPMAI